jgi:hypothetical protein
MSGFEWFLLVVVVILVPLVVAVAITLWTLEQARQRNRKNRAGAGSDGGPVKRKATRDAGTDSTGVATAGVADSPRNNAGGYITTGSPDGWPKAPVVETVESRKNASGGEGDPLRNVPVTPRADDSLFAGDSSKGTAADGPSGDSGGSSEGGAGSADGGGGGDG